MSSDGGKVFCPRCSNLFFVNGVLVERIVGFSGEGRILDTVREILLKCPVASTFG